MIKVFDVSTDGSTFVEKIVASNRGDGIYTKSIVFDTSYSDASIKDSTEYYKDADDTNIVTLDVALNQLKNEIRETKEGVAWVYKNGTIGGGGGGGSLGAISFKVESPNYQISNGQIIVNNGDSVPLNFAIKGSSIGRKMIITIRDKNGNIYDGYRNATYVVSSKSTTILIPEITNDTYIEFSGYDSETLGMIEPYTLNIKVAALKITGPTAVQIPQSDTEYVIEYGIETTDGQMTSLAITTNIEGKEYKYVHPDYFTYNTKISLNIFDIFTDLEGNKLDLYDAIQRGAASNFTLNATISGGGYNAKCATSVVVTDPNKITIDIIPLDNISSTVKDTDDEDHYIQIENLDANLVPGYQYIENNNITFTVKLYFNTQQYRMYYELYQFDNNNNPVILFSKGNLDNYIDITNQPTGTTYYQSSTQITIPYTSLNGIDVAKPVFVYIKAWDKVDPTQYSGEVTKWFGIQNDSTWMAFHPALSGKDYYDDFMNYLYYYWNQNAISDIPGDIWKSERSYTGSLTTPQTIKGYIKYYNCNNITNGLVLRGSGLYENNMLRLSSNAYATLLDSASNNFLPFASNTDKNWMYDSNGWTMSFLVKTDTQPDTDNVILSYANYDSLDNFTEGIYITTEDVKIVLQDTAGSKDKFNLSAKLAQDTLNQIDIVFIPGKESDTKAQLKLYINGVLAAAGITSDGYFEYNSSVKKITTIDSPFTFTAKNSTRTGASKFSDTNFYRVMFYKRWLTDFHIIKNYIQGQAEVNLTKDGDIDKAANIELRNKNFFFGNDGKCSLIYDRIENWTNECKVVDNLYAKLTSDGNNPLPIVCISIEDTVGEQFKNTVSRRYSEAEVAADKKKEENEKTITKKYQASFEIIPAKSTAATAFTFGPGHKNSATTDFAQDGLPWITLQGTSTLGYLSKNFQIGFGHSDNKGNHLVQVFEDMLPENEYILKADVMDSGHANNAAIGKFINEFLGSDEQLILPTTARNNDKNLYRKEVKHTTLGHPCILFIKYRDTENPIFHGIYSFNLGRISYYNLGYNVFDGYYKVTSGSGEGASEYQVEYDINHKVTNPDIKFPAFVSTYKSIAIPYTSDLTGIDSNYSTAVCYECNKNDNAVGSFQQYNVINSFYDLVYPAVTNTNTDKSFDHFRKIFVATAHMYGADPNNDITSVTSELTDGAQRTRSNLMRNEEGKFKLKGKNEYEVFNIDNYNANLYEEFDTKWSPTSQYLSFTSPQGPSSDEEWNVGMMWDHASAYFVLAMLFGLTDSLGKNLNIRSFDQKSWYTSFYDMDTGLALTNSGNETVKKDAYLDIFSNNSSNTGLSVKINGYSSGAYDTFNSRLWNIIRFLTNTYDETDGNKPTVNYRKIWDALRRGMLKDPNNFINNYYIAQNRNVGEIIFNQDYYTKYVQDEIDKIDKPSESAASSISLLHGNRINFVKDWFTKHVYFLDGVFDLGAKDTTKSEAAIQMYGNYAATQNVYGGDNAKPISVTYDINDTTAAPYTIMSDQKDRVNPPSSGNRTFTVKSNLPMFFVYANSTNGQRLYIPEGVPTTVSLNLVGGNEQTMSYNFVPYLTTFNKLGNLFYVTMDDIKLRSLTELDLSNMKTLSGVVFNISSMVELRKLNMENVTVLDTNNKLSVNLINSTKINYINLRNSAVNQLILPGEGKNPGGSLETLIIDGTNITDIDLSNQAMLSTFSASNCPVLKNVKFYNNTLLKNVGSLPSTIETLYIDECKSLESVNLINMIDLTDSKFYIGKVPALKTFVYTASNDKNAKYLTKLDLSGATNLESIQLQGFKGNYITLALSAKKTLTDINFANSSIQYIRWFDTETNQEYYSKVGYSRDKDYSTFSHENVFDFSECKKLQRFNLSKTSVKYIILPEGRTFNIDSAVSNCDALERIVGNINISSNSLLKSLKKFRFNEVASYETTNNDIKNKNYLTSNIVLDFETGNFTVNELPETEFDTIIDGNNTYINVKNFVTNFTFNIKDATELCAGSSINVSDMYAVLIKLGDSVKTLDKTFENCKNIHTGRISTLAQPVDINKFYVLEYESLLPNMFKFNKNIETLYRTFAGTDINNFIDNIFKHLKNIKEFNETFANTGGLWITGTVFDINNGAENNIKIIKNPFSPATQGQVELYDFFKTLNNLEDITGLFYGTKIQITTGSSFRQLTTKTLGEVNLIKCFVNNPKLHKVSKWLNTRQAVLSSEKYLDIADIFGGVTRWLHNIGEITDEQLVVDGKYNINNTYPRDLYDLSECFATTTEKESSLILDWKYMDKLFYNLSYDSEFNCCLENCANMFNNVPKIKVVSGQGEASAYAVNKDGSDAEFPVNIFNVTDKDGNQIYFNKLKSVAGMFRESAFKKTLDFPGNIFKYCRCSDGLDISEFLKNTVIMPINLVSVVTNPEYDCFRHCKITKAASLFEDCAKTLDPSLASLAISGNEMYSRFDNGGVRNPIPYKFFYMENSNGMPITSITSLDRAFKNCNWMGCRVDTVQVADLTPRYNNREMFYTTPRPTYDELVAMRGRNVSAAELKTLVAKNELGAYDWDPWSYDGEVLSDEYTNELTADLISRITENSGKKTSGKSYLETKYETIESYVDYVMDSSKVDFDASLSDILSGNSALANAYIGKYEKATTKDSSILRIYYDADKDPKFVNIDYKVDGGDVNSYTIWGMSPNMDGLSYNQIPTLPTKFVSNYMLPMDLFRYCTPICTIDNMFEDLSRFNRKDRTSSDKTHFIYGLIGRIPPKLFEPLQNLQNMKNVFLGCKGITPYAQSLDGQYYRFMFKKNTSLNSLDFTFSGTMILGSLTEDFIKTNTSLRSLEGTFKNGYMPSQYINDKLGDYKNFINVEMFKNNGGLNSTSFMFGKDDQETDDSNMSFDIYDTILSLGSNPALINVNGMFYNQKLIPKTADLNTQICPFHTWVTDCMNAYMGTGFDMKNLGLSEDDLLKYGITA